LSKILKRKFLRYERYLSDRYVININIIYHSCSSHILMTYQQQETVIKTVINLHGLLLIIRPLFQDTTFILLIWPLFQDLTITLIYVIPS